MRKIAGLAVLGVLALGAGGVSGCKEEGSERRAAPRGAALPVATPRGEQLFKERCAPCHPDGGNTVNPKKTLHSRVLADYGIKNARDIASVMRNPGPGMPRFDEATIPDQDAVLVGEYVLATFR